MNARLGRLWICFCLWIENHGYGWLFWMRGKDQLDKTFYAVIFWTQVRLSPCLVTHSQFSLSVSNAFANQVDVCKRFVKVVSGICQSCYIDLSKLFHGFVKVGIWICQVLICISCPNQTRQKFDQDFKGRWRIYACAVQLNGSFFCKEWKDCVIMKLKFEWLLIG